MALQYWAFTWNANNDKTATWDLERDSLIKFFNERGWRWVFQHERVTRDHWQGRIDLKDKASRCTKTTMLETFGAGGFDTKHLTMLPESNNSIKKEGVAFYVTKVDSRVDGPWFDGSFTMPVKRKAYEGRDLACMDIPLKWQKSAYDIIIAENTDDRSVIWVYNPAGNVGKSKFQKWLCWKGKAKRVCLGTATQIKTAIATAGAYSCYLCNLPRVSGNQESQRDLFSALEDIKDGWVESNMYGKDNQLFMDPPHLWVFSNDLPNLSLCSMDRWKIYRLLKKDDDLVEMTKEEVLTKQRELSTVGATL